MRSKLHLPVLMLSICCVAIAGGLVARKAASAPAAKASAAPRQEVRLEIEKDPRVRVAAEPGRREAPRGLHRETRGSEVTCQARPLRRSAVTIARNPPAQ